MTLTYGGSGVDIPGIKKIHGKMGRIIARTHGAQKKSKVFHGFGHYAGLVEVERGTLLATHTDGVGTKAMVACRMKKYDTIGIDCIAMNVNDVICTGATPVSFVDYIAASRNDGDALVDITRGLAAGAKKGSVPIVGGETAIMPDMFDQKGFSFDLSGTVVGVVPKKKVILGDRIRRGDVIIGARSSGIHSNGYTLARRALAKYPYSHRIGGRTLGEALLEPTEIYVKPVLEMAGTLDLHGLAHITGGSFTKLLRLKETGFELDGLPKIPPIMELIGGQVDDDEMYRTFNMGVGFCVIAPSELEGEIIAAFKRHRIKSQRIGSIIQKRGVFVNSKRIA